MYTAIDLVVDKLERQIRKNKTKLNRKRRGKEHYRESYINSLLEPLVVDEEEDEETSLESILVRKKTFEIKPMDVEEAILQMTLLGHKFFIFLDASTNRPAVLYKREDGKYGLIETNF